MSRPTTTILWKPALAIGLALALFASACGDDSDVSTGGSTQQPAQDDEFGPMAVVGPSDGSDGALISGVLDISEGCVLLDERGDDVLLIWESDNVEWSADAGSIRFGGTDDESIELRDGDAVSFGGGGSSTEEGGLSGADFLASIEWVQAPNESCVADTRWFVGELVAHG